MDNKIYIPVFINDPYVIETVIGMRFTRNAQLQDLSSRDTTILLGAISYSIAKNSPTLIMTRKFRVSENIIAIGSSFYSQQVYPVSEKIIPTQKELNEVYENDVEGPHFDDSREGTTYANE